MIDLSLVKIKEDWDRLECILSITPPEGFMSSDKYMGEAVEKIRIIMGNAIYDIGLIEKIINIKLQYMLQAKKDPKWKFIQDKSITELIEIHKNHGAKNRQSTSKMYKRLH